MTEPYIEPGDVGPLDARKVVAFLNAARTAREIGDAVEFPDERDVGIRVGQRIIDRRDELGGFTSLQQVADVPQVGPERFTEIVLALSRRPTPESVAAAFLDEMVSEARALRARLDAFGAELRDHLRIELRSVLAGPYLGQPASVVATVTAGDPPEPVSEVPVTLTTTWGALEVFGNGGLVAAPAVTARTDVLGNVTAALLPPLTEPLLHSQEAALVAALGALDPSAETPAAGVEGLRELVRAYRWPPNNDLRAAVDILFRDLGARTAETVNTFDYMSQWRFLDATVVAFAGTPDDGSAVRATATATVRLIDWLGAWLETHIALVEADGRIRDDLAFRKSRAPDAAAAVDRIGARLTSFIDASEGIAGRLVAARIARATLEDFVHTEVDDLGLDDKVMVFSALQAAAATVSSAGLAGLQSLTESRASTRGELTGKIAAAHETVALELLSQIDSIEAELATKVTPAQLEALQLQITESVDIKLQDALATKVDNATLDRALAAKADSATLAQRFETLDTKISRIERESPP